jgi:hypothetical protein
MGGQQKSPQKHESRWCEAKGAHCAFADEKNADNMGGDFVLAQEVRHKGGDVDSTAISDDFVRRLRQIELLPRLASNDIRSR